MANKFTEEQYHKIVERHDKQDFSVDGTLDVVAYFVHNISRTGDADIDMALAIANPLTREWAHDKFVEKEKRYVWTSKNTDNEGRRSRLYKRAGGSIATTLISSFSDELDQLTESEIREWGYNQDMFDREEV